MTTNFNFTINNGFDAKDFAKVCVKMEEAMKLYEQTQKIYAFLKAHPGNEFTCTEIGLALGYPFSITLPWSGREDVCVKKVSDSLYWLLQMGLVHRNTYVEKITIDLGYREKVKDVKIIDGVEYVGYIYKTTREVDSKTNKWSAL